MKMRLLCLVVVASLLVCEVRANSTFKVGAVLSTQGDTASMAEARNGYELYFKTVNAQSNGHGFPVGGKNETRRFYFKYDFHWREDRSDPKIHEDQVKDLIQRDKIHFLGGSHPTYAAEEMRIANESGILNYHCCTGPDELYALNYQTVFGIPASNIHYTKNSIRAVALQGVTKFMIVYQEDEAFPKTTCEFALFYLEEAESVHAESEPPIVKTFKKKTLSPEFFADVAAEAKRNGIEAVYACAFPSEGKQLVNALHEIEYPLRAFFLTTGPTKQDWIDTFDPSFRANGLQSAAQWHPGSGLRDDVMGTAVDYATLYVNTFHGQEPTYVAAGASAVGLTLTMAIQAAFNSCDISQTNGDSELLLYNSTAILCDDISLGSTGYERVMASLWKLDVKTFYGAVKFNEFRRNNGLEPVTTQVFEVVEEDNTVTRKIEVVLPVQTATRLMHFPATNYYREKCSPGYKQNIDPFLECLPCQPGQATHKTDALHCDRCPIGEWTNLTAQSECFKCPAGTCTQIRGADKLEECRCKMGYFNAEGKTGVACDPCPVGAECPGGTEPPIPLPGYWANATRRAEIYACDDASVCKGGKEVTCETGHGGRLCAQCEDGYFNALQGCCKCLDTGMIVFLLVALLVGWYIINVTVSRSVTSMEMMLGWAQLANIIGDINLNWTQMVTTMFGVANLLDFDVDILEPSCIVEWGFRANFVTQLLLPFVMSTMAASGYLSSAAVHFLIRKGWLKLDERTERLLSVFVAVTEDEERLQEKWDTTVATFLAAVDVTYVTIAKYCCDVFRCEDIAGVSVLKESPDVLCGDAYHLSLRLLAVLGFLFYVIGYPAYIFWKLCELRAKCAFADAQNLRRLGFVYQKFELDYYFTPAIIIGRKLLFVLVLVYVRNPAFQVGVLSIVINISLMIHVYTAPYVDTYFDVLFSFLLVALMFEAFGGLMFYSENLPDDYRRILEWLIISSLLILTIVFLVILCMEIAKKFCMRYVRRAQVAYVSKDRDGCRRRSVRTTASVRGKISTRTVPPRPHLSPIPSSNVDEVSFELLETFRPSFVYNSIRKQPESIKEWNELTNKLKDYMSDQSDTAYLSMNPVAKFWRKLVDRFPELVDFLAVADDETRQKFKVVATCLFRDFYLTNKVTPLPLMDVLNWRDHAPMAQWLAIAPPKHREFFLYVMAEMFESNENAEAAAILRSRIRKGRSDPLLEHRRLVRMNRSISRILSSLSSGLSPFDHTAMSPIIQLPGSQNRPNAAISQGSRPGALDILILDDRQRPTAPMTPIPSEQSLSRLTASGGFSMTECSSSVSEASDRIRLDTSCVGEITSARDRLNKQNNDGSARSRINNSLSFADETDA